MAKRHDPKDTQRKNPFLPDPDEYYFDDELGLQWQFMGNWRPDFYDCGDIVYKVVEKDLQEKFANDDMVLYAVSTCNEDETEEWRQEIAARFPGYEVRKDYLSLSVSCHIGPGALAVAYAKVVK